MALQYAGLYRRVASLPGGSDDDDGVYAHAHGTSIDHIRINRVGKANQSHVFDRFDESIIKQLRGNVVENICLGHWI